MLFLFEISIYIHIKYLHIYRIYTLYSSGRNPEWWSAPYELCHSGGTWSRVSAPPHGEEYLDGMSPGLYVAGLALERLGILPEELGEASGETEVWVSLLRPLS